MTQKKKPNWQDRAKRLLHRAAYGTERVIDTVTGQVRQRVGDADPVYVQPYRGHGSERQCFLRGRVLAGERLDAAVASDTTLDNLRAMAQRFGSRERSGVRVRATLGDAQQVVETDEEGYFQFHLKDEALRRDLNWHEVELQVEEDPTTKTTGRVLVPPSTSRFGVISDVDDTILQTGATDFFTMARLTMLGNAHTRLPFEGVAAFYRALSRGEEGGERNPIFYVSSSPWNLYDFLSQFMDVHGIPAGPIFLRDLGIDRDKFIKAGHHDHKLTQIDRLLTFYTERPFILIGDSGQEDPEIYRKVIEKHPGRVPVIYIRDVTAEARRAEAQELAEEVGRQEAELHLVPDTVAAAEHAAANGFISEDELTAIRAERDKDAAG